MRTILLTLALLAASTAHAQIGSYQVLGSPQTTRYYGYTPVYSRPYYGGYYGGYGGGYYRSARNIGFSDYTTEMRSQTNEIRRLRWAIEDAEMQRGWGW